jgi:prevent-host-death family protein
MSEMESVNISELRNHLPRYLARVEAGEQLLVTRRGRVVARISAVEYGQTAARRQLESLRERARVGDVVSSIEEWFTVER